MINASVIPEIVQYVEKTLEFEYDTGRPSPLSKVRELDPQHVEPIVSYLLHPYAHGYWIYASKWRPNAPIFQFILQELGTFAEVEVDPEANSKSPVALARLLSDEKKEELVYVTSRLSTLHYLFLAAKIDADGKPIPKLHDEFSWIKDLDLSKFRQKFEKAYEAFSVHVYFDSYSASVGRTKRLARTQNGLVNYSKSPRADQAISIESTDKAYLQGLQMFYEAAGVVDCAPIERVFSPEERLFTPYFDFLSGVFSYVIIDERAPDFSQALDYYVRADYTHCISALGLIAEDYLARIYVSLLREQCAPGLTLGQLNDLLHKRIGEILMPAKGTLSNLDPIFEEISLLKDGTDSLRYQAILRRLVNAIKEDRIFFSRRIEELSKPLTKISPFPIRVKENITELLKFRNAAAHNSRVPLGSFEAVRTLYCLISLVSWWQTFYKETDWTKARDEVLALAIEKAK